MSWWYDCNELGMNKSLGGRNSYGMEVSYSFVTCSQLFSQGEHGEMDGCLALLYQGVGGYMCAKDGWMYGVFVFLSFNVRNRMIPSICLFS